MAIIRYRGYTYRAHLRSAKFHGRELFVIAEIDSDDYKVEKELHFSAVIGYDWTRTANEAA